MNASRLLDLAAAAGRLKRVPRTGWVRAGVSGPESVADHSFRLALLALALAPELGLDAGRAVAIALVHDLAESELGDRYVDPRQPDARARQRAKGEEEAEVLSRLAPDPSWQGWFDEYRTGSSAEGRLVRALDKLEMALTALDYESESATDLTEFWESAAEGIGTGPVAEALAAARLRRPDR